MYIRLIYLIIDVFIFNNGSGSKSIMDSLVYQKFVDTYNKALENPWDTTSLTSIIYVVVKIATHLFPYTGIEFYEGRVKKVSITLEGSSCTEFLFDKIKIAEDYYNSRSDNLFNDYIKQYILKITDLLGLKETCYHDVYLFLTCLNYEELKKINSEIADAIDTTYLDIQALVNYKSVQKCEMAKNRIISGKNLSNEKLNKINQSYLIIQGKLTSDNMKIYNIIENKLICDKVSTPITNKCLENSMLFSNHCIKHSDAKKYNFTSFINLCNDNYSRCL